MARILVTGGAGFIGSHVVDGFIDAGHEVTVVDNLATGHREYVNPKAKFIELDIRSEGLARVFAEEEPEVVDHLAAQADVTLSLKKPTFDAKTNVLGTINLLQQSVEHGVKKFIFASTAGAIYGEPENLPVAEDTAPNPLSHYGLSKYVGERYIRLYHLIYGLPFTILRYANVYGPRQLPHGESGVCAIFAELMLAGKTPVLYGHGTAIRDYVFVSDIARANLLALDRADGATMNLATGTGTSVREIFDIMREIIGFKAEPVLKPLRAGEVNKIYISAEHARQLVGWSPQISLTDGLRQTVDFFRKRRAT